MAVCVLVVRVCVLVVLCGEWLCVCWLCVYGGGKGVVTAARFVPADLAAFCGLAG
jgi:hypothetical protein